MDPIFDPINCIIDFSNHKPSNNGILVINSVRDIYSAWKRWAKKDNNIKYDEICKSLGGEPLPDGSNIEVAIIIKEGWRIMPPNQRHQLVIEGKIYIENGDFPIAEVADNVEIFVVGLDKEHIDNDKVKLIDTIEMSPNFFGMGINLKKAWELLK